MVDQVFSCFEENNTVGIIGPEGYVSPLSYYWGQNKKRVEEMSCRLGVDEISIQEYKFVAGTMFYARIAALLPLLNLSISDEDFESEQGQIGGTLAHAIERVIA